MEMSFSYWLVMGPRRVDVVKAYSPNSWNLSKSSAPGLRIRPRLELFQACFLAPCLRHHPRSRTTGSLASLPLGPLICRSQMSPLNSEARGKHIRDFLSCNLAPGQHFLPSQFESTLKPTFANRSCLVALEQLANYQVQCRGCAYFDSPTPAHKAARARPTVLYMIHACPSGRAGLPSTLLWLGRVKHHGFRETREVS